MNISNISPEPENRSYELRPVENCPSGCKSYTWLDRPPRDFSDYPWFQKAKLEGYRCAVSGIKNNPYDNEYCAEHQGWKAGFELAIKDGTLASMRPRAFDPNQHADAVRVIEWMDNPNRPPAALSFTEGMERQIAYRFECPK